MSSGPHRPSCLHGALGCSALPPGANCSPGCSALLPRVLCSPWALSAPPGVQCRSWGSVLPVGAQCSPLGAQHSPQAFCALPGHSVLPPGAQCSPRVFSAPPRCSPLVLSALPGCSVLLLVLSTPPWCSVLTPGCSALPRDAQCSALVLSAPLWVLSAPAGLVGTSPPPGSPCPPGPPLNSVSLISLPALTHSY